MISKSKKATNLRLGHEKLRRIRRISFEFDEPMSTLMTRWIDRGLAKAEARLAKKRAAEIAAATATAAENTVVA